MKKVLTYVVVVATMVWSLGIASIVPAFAATKAVATVSYTTPVAGDLVKTPTYSAVYFIGSDLKKYLFSTENTFFTWYSGTWAQNPVKNISQTDFDAISLGGNVTARPGVSLMKFDNSPKVYAVTPTGITYVSDSVAQALYGATYAKGVITIQASFESNYTKLADTTSYPTATLVKLASSDAVYYINGTTKQLVTSDVFTASKFKSSAVLTVPSLAAYTDGAALASSFNVVTPGVGPVISGSVTVSLAANTPASNTIIAGQAIADLGHFVFAGTGNVTTLKIKRIGVSQDATLNNVYLYDGNTKLTDAGTVSNSYVTFSNPNGIFTVSGSRTISVKADILADTASQTVSGQTVGVAINAASDVSGVNVTGSFPIVANIQSIASATNLAQANFSSSVTGAASTINAGTINTTIWSDSVSISNKAVALNYVKLTQIGSVTSANINNFKLYVDGNQVGTASLSSDNTLAFDLSASPVNMNTGNRTIEVRADINSGASKTFSFSLQQASDVVLVDTNYGVAITPTRAGSSFSAISTGTSTIAGASTGALTITTDPSYNATQIVKNSSNVTLGKWIVKAYGEDVKVMQLSSVANVAFGAGVTSTSEFINNVAIYVDGVQVGSAQNANLSALAGLNSSSTSGTGSITTTYGSGNLFTVAAGQTRTIEIRGDLQLNDSTRVSSVSANLLIPANEVQGVSSFQTWPASSVTYTAANTLSVVGGQLTVGKTASFVNQTVAPNVAAQKIGSFTVQASNAEGVRISNVNVAIATAGNTVGGLSTNYLSDLYIATGSTLSSKVNPQASNNFSVDFTIPANGTQVVDIYSTIGNATGTVSTTVSFTGRTVSSQTTANGGPTVGQTITVGNGTLNTANFANPIVNTSMQAVYAIGGSSASSFVVYNLKATNAPITVDEMTFGIALGGTATSGDVPVTSVGVNGQTANVIGSTVTVTGLNLTVPNTNSGLDVPVTATLNKVGLTGISSNDSAKLTLTSVKWHAGGTTATTGVTASSSNEIFIVNSKPVVTLNSVTDKLTNNTTRVGQLTVAADANGAITLEQVPLTFSTTTGITFGSNAVVLKDGGSTINTTSGTINGSTGAATVVITGGYKISAGQTKTFDIYVTPSGVTGTSGSASVSVALSSNAANFLWDDTDGTSSGLGLHGTNIYNFPSNTVSVQN